MIFEKGNKIKYGQDFSFYCGIPEEIDFVVSTFAPGRYKLTAYGYGRLDVPNAYGNGSLYVFGLTKDQEKEFAKAAISSGDLI